MSLRRLAPIVLSAALLHPAGATAQTAEHTLSAVGRGQVELRPDGGRFAFAVKQTARTANRARRKVNTRVARVVRGLRAAGVDRDQLTTQHVSVSRNRRRRDGDRPVRVRYHALVYIEVTVEGLKPLARAMDGAARAGATDVYGPELTVSPEVRRAGSTRAEAKALVDARERAEAAAEATGQRIVGIQSIDLDPVHEGFDPLTLDSAGASDGGRRASRTRIFAARQTFTSRVRVTYVMEPAS